MFVQKSWYSVAEPMHLIMHHERVTRVTESRFGAAWLTQPINHSFLERGFNMKFQ